MSLRKTTLALSLVAAGALLAVGIRKVLADGIPMTTPLFYSGYLTENGVPVNTHRHLTINLWGNESVKPGDTNLCTTDLPNVAVTNGRFRVALNDGCKSAISKTRDTWVEVVVDANTSLGRLKIGAVPYAVEADRASQAAGALDMRIAAVEKLAQTATVPAEQRVLVAVSDAKSQYSSYPPGTTTPQIYEAIKLTLTPGTWIVSGQAFVSTGAAGAQARLKLWNATDTKEVPNSAGNTRPTNSAGEGMSTAATVVTTAKNIDLQLLGDFGSTTTNYLGAGPTGDTQIITAVKLSN